MNKETFIESLRQYKGETGEQSGVFDYFGCKTDWCCMFVCMVYRKQIPDFHKTTSCCRLQDLMREHVNKDFATIEVGDILFFENNRCPEDGPDHVGIVVGRKGDTIEVIEGNTGGNSYLNSTVSINKYAIPYGLMDSIIDMSWYWNSYCEPVTNSVDWKELRKIYDELGAFIDKNSTNKNL